MPQILSQTSASAFSNSAPLIIILGLVILAVIAYITYKVIKKRLNQKKLITKSQLLDQKVALRYQEYVLKISAIIAINEKLLKAFQEGKSGFKMSQINRKVLKSLKALKQSKIYHIFFSQNQNYRDFNYYLNFLINTKSNLWKKKNEQALTFFQKQELVFKTKKEHQKYLQKLAQESLALYES